MCECSRLYLGDNRLTGTVPSVLLSLSSLKEFAVNDNQLTGTIPEATGVLSNFSYVPVTVLLYALCVTRTMAHVTAVVVAVAIPQRVQL